MVCAEVNFILFSIFWSIFQINIDLYSNHYCLRYNSTTFCLLLLQFFNVTKINLKTDEVSFHHFSNGAWKTKITMLKLIRKIHWLPRKRNNSENETGAYAVKWLLTIFDMIWMLTMINWFFIQRREKKAREKKKWQW